MATVVPAMNLYAVATLCLAVAAPVISRAVQVSAFSLAAVLAAAAGPLLARLVEARTDVALLTPGTIALAAAGTMIGLILIWAMTRLTLPAR